MDQIILTVDRFLVFTNRKTYMQHIGEVYVEKVNGKEHGTLISTYLITQIESECLIIKGRRVFSVSP